MGDDLGIIGHGYLAEWRSEGVNKKAPANAGVDGMRESASR